MSWMFEKKGLLVKRDVISEDALMELVLEAGADDVVAEDDVWEVTCEPASFFAAVKIKLEEKVAVEMAEIQMLPKSRCSSAAKRRNK